MTPLEIYYSSYSYLNKGDYKKGFDDFEYRWHPETTKHLKLTDDNIWKKLSKAPTWKGEDLFGKTIVVQMEMGYGDCFMFYRYLPVLKAYGARQVIVLQTKSLHNIVAQLNCVDLITNNENAPEVQNAHYWVGSMSLPHFVINGPSYIRNLFLTTKDYVFCKDGYIDAIPCELPGKIKIGLNWQAASRGDLYEIKSISLEEISKIQKEFPQVTFYSFNPLENGTFNKLSNEKWKEDWSETARFMKSMDYIISVDTGTVHLAGALGVKTLMLLPEEKHVCWRWKYDNWYSSIIKFENTNGINNIIDFLKNNLGK